MGHNVGQGRLAQGLLQLVLNVHSHRQLERSAAQRLLEQGQLPVGLCLGGGLEVAIHAHRDVQALALGVVAGEIGVDVGLAGFALFAVAHGPDHHAGNKAACLDLVPVNAALPAGNVKYGSGHCSAPPLQYSKCLPHKLANSYRCHHWAKS